MEFEKPREIVHYPIPGDVKGGVLYVYGDSSAQNMALMVTGFPDDQKPFLPMASRLAKETDTLVGVACLPGFDDREDKPWTSHKKKRPDGYTFDDWAASLREAAKALRAESTSQTKPKLTGIFHDWGVMAGIIWANRAISDGPDYSPDELVCFDVLANPTTEDEKLSFRQILINHYYQYMLAFGFVISRYMGDAFGTMALISALIPLLVLGISPTRKVDKETRNQLGHPSITHSLYMGYPYYNMLKDIGLKKWMKHQFHEDCRLPSDLKRTPLLYLYGTDKSANFHKEQSLKILQRECDEKRSKSKAIPIDGAGHYLFLQKPDICFDHVAEFMRS